MEDFKKSFGANESRNQANRSNKPIATELAKSDKFNTLIRVKRHSSADDSDSDEDDDNIFGRAGSKDDEDDDDDNTNNDLRKSFGKPKGPGKLAEMKAKLSLSEELGAMKSELREFDAEKAREEALKASNITNFDNVEERDDADDLDDSDDDDDADDNQVYTAKDIA